MEPKASQFNYEVIPERKHEGRITSGKTVAAFDKNGELAAHLEDRSHLNDTSVAAVVQKTKNPEELYAGLRDHAAKNGIPTDNVRDEYHAGTPLHEVIGK